MSQSVKFVYLSQSEYDSLEQKSQSTIYFTSDTYRIYKGEDLYVTRDYSDIQFNDMVVNSLTVDNIPVSIEGHTHTFNDLKDDDDKIDAGRITINNVGDPEDNYDAATKKYVDDAIASAINNLKQELGLVTE